jgi:hypothetical protein
MAVTYSRYKFLTVSLPKRLRNGRFTSETAVLFKPPGSKSGLKYPLELLESSIYDSFSMRGRWAWL